MNTKQTISDRIVLYLQQNKISMTKFSTSNNLDPSMIIRQLKNKSALSAKTIETFVSSYPGVNLSWLLLGDGPMLLPTYDTAPEPAPAPPVAVRADHVAQAETTTGTPSIPTLSDALAVIKSQQAIIERQAEMLENLLHSTKTNQDNTQPLNKKSI